MSDTTRAGSERVRRRQEITRRRRAREVAETIATNTGRLDDLKERRTPQTPIRQVQDIDTEAVHVADSISQTTRATTAAVYGTHNYGEAAYGGPHVD